MDLSSRDIPIHNSSHTGSAVIKDEGCVICHMALEERNPAGGHTMLLETEEGELTAGCETSGCHLKLWNLTTKEPGLKLKDY